MFIDVEDLPNNHDMWPNERTVLLAYVLWKLDPHKAPVPSALRTATAKSTHIEDVYANDDGSITIVTNRRNSYTLKLERSS